MCVCVCVYVCVCSPPMVVNIVLCGEEMGDTGAASGTGWLNYYLDTGEHKGRLFCVDIPLINNMTLLNIN